MPANAKPTVCINCYYRGDRDYMTTWLETVAKGYFWKDHDDKDTVLDCF